MSHTATIDIDVKDASVVVKAAQRLGFELHQIFLHIYHHHLIHHH